MPTFFEPPPPPPAPEAEPPWQPWAGAGGNVVGKTVALNLVIGRSEKAAIWIPAVTVFPNGFEFDVELRHRLEGEEVEHAFMHPRLARRRRRQQREELDPAVVRIGIQFGDGRKATNLGGWPVGIPGEPYVSPEAPLLTSRGGGGGDGRWHQQFWVWPLPPEGPLAFVSEWPAMGIAETRREIDSAVLREAAAEMTELWPVEADSRGSDAGGSSFMVSMLRATSTGEPKEERLAHWHDFGVESTRKTQLIDITQQVGEFVSGADGAAVIVFAPHTTAGVMLQAAGADATKVAADVETAFERLVDESGAWQHVDEGDRNPWSHVRSALTASSVTIPLENGKLALGALQRVFFCEFDGPRNRRVRVRVV